MLSYLLLTRQGDAKGKRFRMFRMVAFNRKQNI